MGAVINGRVACTEILATERIKGVETMFPAFEPGRSRLSEKTEFSPERFVWRVEEDDIDSHGEIARDACIRLLERSADRYIDGRTALLKRTWPGFDATAAYVYFFSMRFVFVPFVKIKPGEEVEVEVTFSPKELGKGEFVQNIFHKQTAKKLANAGGHVLIRNGGGAR